MRIPVAITSRPVRLALGSLVVAAIMVAVTPSRSEANALGGALGGALIGGILLGGGGAVVGGIMGGAVGAANERRRYYRYRRGTHGYRYRRNMDRRRRYKSRNHGPR